MLSHHLFWSKYHGYTTTTCAMLIINIYYIVWYPSSNLQWISRGKAWTMNLFEFYLLFEYLRRFKNLIWKKTNFLSVGKSQESKNNKFSFYSLSRPDSENAWSVQWTQSVFVYFLEINKCLRKYLLCDDYTVAHRVLFW